MKQYLIALFVLLNVMVNAQDGIIQGVITDEDGSPLQNVNITVAGTNLGTVSLQNGFYRLMVPAGQKLNIRFTSIGLKDIEVRDLIVKKSPPFEFNPVMKIDEFQITTVTIRNIESQEFEGVTTIKPDIVRAMPGIQSGVENLLKSLPGVGSNNELSTQYTVRGGNFDENLVYINEIEVYRPFLIRSGQQEGLSIVNSDLVRDVRFSAGGFQSKYGDKLSSVLDIDYRRPTTFGAGIDASLLGVNMFVEGTAFSKAATGILGLRYRDNSLLVNSRNTEANTVPVFIDAQTYLTYQINNKLELSFLGNIAINSFEFEPLTSQTNFGTVDDAQALVINYDGFEDDQYETYFGALKASYDVNESLNLRLITSIYHTQEQEHFDILGRYSLGRPNTDIGGSNLGQVDFTRGIGSELDHGRNDLDALIITAQLKGTYIIEDAVNETDQLDWGIKFNSEDIRDRVREYTVIDSAGFNVRPPIRQFANDEPYSPFVAPLEPFESIRANNDVQVTRLQAFAQYNSRGYLGDHQIFWNAGARSHTWNVNGAGIEGVTQTVVSPRGQFAIKPYWTNTDMLFRFSTGLYYQPPFYRELRDRTGTVVPDVKAQRSIHFVAGNDWSFNWNNRPFKLTTEAYYKGLSDVNTYTVENVRIRYRANNEAEAYAYGFEMRLNGEFIKGTESWISLGYLKTEENLNDRGFISRPTDQRLKAAFLFQDYVPNIPKLRAYLNMVYNTGLPGGSPSYADPYLFQFRLKDYFRSDLGIQYVFVDANNTAKSGSWLSNFKELSLGAQIYNIFDRQNQISNLWVRDVVSSTQFAVPVRLTPRIFNIRLIAKL
ncbi:MAG: carboxypeptidase-like regulatory domain-containing protein [Nonlabens sp.]